MHIKDIDAGLSQKEISKTGSYSNRKKVYNLCIVQDEGYITNLLNAQNDFIILTDGKEIICANVQLFQFLNYKNINEFKKSTTAFVNFLLKKTAICQII